MAYTTHGHHIPGTTKEGRPDKVARCGGPGLCKTCSMEATIETNKEDYKLEEFSYNPDQTWGAQ